MTRYVIWASDHDQWWAPNRSGYTGELMRAGRYTLAEVAEILDNDAFGEQVVMTWDNADRMARRVQGISAVRPTAVLA